MTAKKEDRKGNRGYLEDSSATYPRPGFKSKSVTARENYPGEFRNHEYEAKQNKYLHIVAQVYSAF